jgi:hypothetical protein
MQFKPSITKPRVTAVNRAAKRLDKSPYQILKMIGCGELEAEEFDDRVAVRIDSLERYEAAARPTAA